jgi:CheY-like chemotaxis protein
VTELKRILLVEDSANDVALTLAALEETNLANEVDVVRDGQQALDYLRREGPWSERPEGNPAVVLLDLKLPKVDGLQVWTGCRCSPTSRATPCSRPCRW